MRLGINIKKKHLFIFLGVLVLVSSVGVYAIWIEPFGDGWHDGEHVKVTLGGQDVQLQEAIDRLAITSSSSFYYLKCPWFRSWQQSFPNPPGQCTPASCQSGDISVHDVCITTTVISVGGVNTGTGYCERLCRVGM